MTTFTVQTVHYTPGVEVVTISVRATDGPFAGQVRDLYTAQDALGDAWGDTEVAREAEVQLAAMGVTLRAQLDQRARIVRMTATTAVVRVAVANPIAGGDVSIAYVATGLTVTPASPQTLVAASVPRVLDGSAYVDFTVDRSPDARPRFIVTATSPGRVADVDIVPIPPLDPPPPPPPPAPPETPPIP